MIVVRWCTIGDDKVPSHFRVVIKDKPKIERLCFDELGQESWRPSTYQAHLLAQSQAIIVDVLTRAVQYASCNAIPKTGIIDLGVRK